MKLRPVTLGPLAGHTTHAEANVWVSGDRGCWARLRHRPVMDGASKTSADWTVGRPIELVESLDWCATAPLAFPSGATALEFEAGIVETADQTLSPEDWESLPSWSRGRVARPPVVGDSTPFSFLFGSCRHKGYWFRPQGDVAMQAIRESQAGSHRDSFIIMGGDQVYCDHSVSRLGFFHGLLSPFADQVPKSVADFFRAYRTYFAPAHFRWVTSHISTYMMYDDHEIRDNWGRYKFGKAGWPAEHLDAGLAAYDAYQGIHSPAATHLATRRWYKFKWGCAEFFVLDTRGEREDPLGQTGSAHPRMLGEPQMAELEKFLASPPECDPCYRFVVSSVPLAPDTQASDVASADTWRAYPAQRVHLLEFIAKSAPVVPIFLSGDLHIGEHVEIRDERDATLAIPCVMSPAFNWFFFGTQPKRGVLPKSLGKFALETGRLPQTPSELEIPPEKRTGPYSCKPTSETFTDNGFVRVRVDRGGVDVMFVRASDGSTQKNVRIERSALVRPNAQKAA